MSQIKAIVSHMYARAALVLAIWGFKLLLSRPPKRDRGTAAAATTSGRQQPAIRPCQVIDAKSFKPRNPHWLVRWLEYDPATSQQPACPVVQQWLQDGSAERTRQLVAAGQAAELFSLDRSVRFLNHGSYGAALVLAQQAQQWYLRELERQPVLFMETTGMQHLVDALYSVAQLMRLDWRDLAPVTNATSAINAVVKSQQLQHGDLLLMTSLTYPAVKSTLAQAAAHAGASLLQVDLDSTWLSSQDATVAAFAEAIRQGGRRIKLAVIDHVVSFPPVVLPVQRVASLCAQVGIPLLVDGAHALGSLGALDIPSLGATYYTTNLHKWLCAPKGCALLWAAKGAQGALQPNVVSHGHGLGFRGDFIFKGSSDSSAWLAAPACVEVFRALGLQEVASRNHVLLRQAVEMLQQRWGTTRVRGGMPGQPYCCSMAAVELPQLAAFEIGIEGAIALHDLLREHHSIEVPVACWENKLWVRLSAQMYNNMEQYEALACAIAEIQTT